jgi:hypothetical protein
MKTKESRFPSNKRTLSLSLSLAAFALGAALFATAPQAKAQGVTTQNAGATGISSTVFDSADGKDSATVEFAGLPSSTIAPEPVSASVAEAGTSGTALPTYNAVPEPASFALIGLGGLALLLHRRRWA